MTAPDRGYEEARFWAGCAVMCFALGLVVAVIALLLGCDPHAWVAFGTAGAVFSVAAIITYITQ